VRRTRGTALRCADNETRFVSFTGAYPSLGAGGTAGGVASSTGLGRSLPSRSSVSEPRGWNTDKEEQRVSGGGQPGCGWSCVNLSPARSPRELQHPLLLIYLFIYLIYSFILTLYLLCFPRRQCVGRQLTQREAKLSSRVPRK